MFRTFIYFSLALLSCGKDTKKEKVNQNFAEREYRQLNQADNMDGFGSSHSGAKISRDKIKAHILKLPLSKSFSNLVLANELELCPIDWSLLLVESSSKSMKWYGEIATECSEFIRSKDGEGGAFFEKRQNIFLDIHFQCSESIIDPEVDDLHKDAASYLNKFMTCEGTELQSSIKIDQTQVKQLKSSSGYVLSEKLTESTKKQNFTASMDSPCVFFNSSLVGRCMPTYSDELVSGVVISKSKERSLETYRHNYYLNFSSMNVKNNQLRGSEAHTSIDNWEGDFTVKPSGLKVFDLKQGEFGSIHFNI